MKDLGQYLTDAYGACSCEPTPSMIGCHHTNVFGPRSAPGRPQLKKGQENNVLVYSGCFNPPHLGHYNLLRRAFEGSQDLNVIVAIIYPVSTTSLAHKCRRRRQWLMFKMADRYWVHDGGRDKFEDMWYRVLESVKRDGFNLKFIEVVGPDHIVPTRVYEPYGWNLPGLHRTIMSNAGRPCDLLKLGGKLDKMRGYGSWENAIDYTKVANPKSGYAKSEVAEERAIDRKSSFDSLLLLSTVQAPEQPHEAGDHKRGTSMESVTDAISESHISADDDKGEVKMESGNDTVPGGERIKVCRRIGDSETWVRFVPAGTAPLTISSTWIRRFLEGGFLQDKALKEVIPERRVMEDEALGVVKVMVLHPEVLARIMFQRYGVAGLDELERESD
ncbi:hypothetical protein BDP81DRAFT_517043 [Colletotrichum phormii]|uniref:Cytidyltransferase-like domain-containing protein n=1 Tax=Colletotrichum phormii TaxID=359342 RepID=A0AAI9ZT06_9PEZI|nr:uncharacterized protein BDP81DRAFT_517043 [Colletotrichum phormii]KAK1637621.1 hypothetical protein BDP81DRAFT_517043 [Colletotrichum phormii]